MSNSETKFRSVPAEQIMKALYEALPKVSKNQALLGLTRSCINCVSFTEKAMQGYQAETCKRFNAHPPARVIAFSCEAWEDVDDIPF